jgi:hypothetical protein
MSNERKAHPYADMFPMMTTEELDALTEDIAAHGLHKPIVLYHGAVLDGRCRLLACERVGVAPAFTDYEGDDEGALALVISLNIQRCSHTSGQRALAAARSEALHTFAEAARERQEAPGEHGKEGGRGKKATSGKDRVGGFLSRKMAARFFKVGENAIQMAKALLAEAPTSRQKSTRAC